GLRGGVMVRPVRPRGDAGRYRGQDQQGSPRAVRRPGIPEDVPRPLPVPVDRGLSRGADELHQVRGTEVAEDAHRSKHQGAMMSADKKDHDVALAKFRESYVELFGAWPALPAGRFNFSGQVNPDFLRTAEELRAQAFYNKTFDMKTTQLILFGM